MANISFGERIRRMRIKNAWTQADLAEKLDVSGPTISNWETGKTSPSSDQKSKLMQMLGAPAGEDSNTRSPEEGPSAFGAWLNRARLERKLSVAELADASGVSVPSIYNLESGRIENPRSQTVRRLESALGLELPAEAKRELREEATIEGLGELVDFDPHDDEDLPSFPGIYVFYDVSNRPIYVGQASNIRSRVKNHRDKFWFKAPIVETAAFVQIDDEALREKVETLLIRFLKSNAIINKQNVDR